jgi:phosphatidylserine/phosphatidylglycerophosphate/cardiolipin synthase-like enzyme
MMRLSSALCLTLLLACDPEPGPGPEPTDDTGDSGDTTLPEATVCSPTANLELVPLDIWGRDLEGAALSLDRAPAVLDDPAAGPGVLLIPLGAEPASLQLVLSGQDHEPAGLAVSYDGGRSAAAFTLGEPSADARVAASWGQRQIGPRSCPVFTVYLGLDHSWFAAGGPGPSLNRSELLINPEQFWEAVADDLGGAAERVSWSTWWWESDFELLRPEGEHQHMSEGERQANTAMAQLEALPGVERRILINRFWDENSDYNAYLNTDTALRSYAEGHGDDFELVLQGNATDVPVEGQWEGEAADFDFGARVLANPRYTDRALVGDRGPQPTPFDYTLQVASWHQKAVVVDGSVAYVTGINTKGTDWDGDEHLVFEPRRMAFDASGEQRQAVADGEALPDFQPRRDYGMRLEGPAVRDVEEILWRRWEDAIEQGELYADGATHFVLDAAPAEVPAAQGGVPTQVAATMPEPWNEQSIRETHAKAIAQAERYIFIEDQYFRAPLMNELIVARMLEVPELVLIVVSMDVSTWDGGAKFTYLSDATFRSLFPDRYLLLQLRSAALHTEEGYIWDDVYFYLEDIYTHSKLRIVDDRYLSVGSCNMNNRGYLYEGELNVSVLDEALAAEARRSILAQLVGSDHASRLGDDMAANLELLRAVSEENAEIAAWWDEAVWDLEADEAEARWRVYRPSGFVYPLEIDADYEWDVGPDLF